MIIRNTHGQIPAYCMKVCAKAGKAQTHLRRVGMEDYIHRNDEMCH